MKIIINNASTTPHLLGRNGHDLITISLAIEKGKIVQISECPLPAPQGTSTEKNSEKVIDATGLFLSPGLLDPQVHFREPGMEYKEDIASGSRAAVKGGFTSVVSMPNTTPTADNVDTVAFMVEKASTTGLCKVYPTGALSKGLEGKEITDFETLQAAGAVAITDDGKGVQNNSLFKQALINAKALGMPVLDHSEDESLSNGGAIHEGDVSRIHNVKGIKASSESVHVKRGCEYSLETGGHYHVLHVSTADSIEAIRQAKAQGANVTVEVSPHHLLLCDEDIPVKADGTLDANWKMNPPLRSKRDMLACREALSEGVIDAIATDHAPHAPHEKALPIEKAPFGIIGLETAFALIYTHFVKTGKLNLNTAVDLMSKQAGAIFNIKCGRIEEGADADLALFDLNTPFTVTPSFFASKSQNSPFINETLYGETYYTLVNGEVKYTRP
ncbi:dihydroorotase [Alteromonas sp. PRIM-21]|uniref:dihydroorotase n=1 Tax=Alteromonas sp. PRIM-21 TaxID=1454978 RepID=UPI0022B9AB3C|nr:dihydroorotase [Alteromonas sp. PRIM-21]MCZ8528551.1 dihydroorotase [Alteromonas sp. PRIM-21]